MGKQLFFDGIQGVFRRFVQKPLTGNRFALSSDESMP